ncbi:hypothetical protein LTR10_023264 [Elasticomyces elasticus]|uniref:Hemerythrin-like domain-containing protein n=1 Tax=Exophiala sideris TaxID=1016849 RepID=A0ABR0JH09_9EURO|nr:hypothetical protein LTR10_023264 [Elasticomyces elasticus]KAK5033443.1 hypothetical protein LTS07_003746 [Exophiala sideris]KAK5042061.1 hypothetical protein LTR13_001867 [Exophiala sideris]KAK5063987.1 hypothetical protein LTR69_003754 [Exophiala sideris]KAK5185329.1 hypothetical protein LTR44_002318 [Eurotiomycetes sp. CCFEE 6388]
MSADSAPSPSLPPLSPADFRIFNRLAEEMEYYHSRFRATWDALYASTAPGKTKLSPMQLINMGIQFCQHLEGHHNIEEAHWFPFLARKMEGFRPRHFAKDQHKEIHKGLEALMPYLLECKRGDRELRRDEVRTIMDSFSDVLWRHLDEEVKELEAENMRKYWTKEEMKRFPF